MSSFLLEHGCEKFGRIKVQAENVTEDDTSRISDGTHYRRSMTGFGVEKHEIIKYSTKDRSRMYRNWHRKN